MKQDRFLIAILAGIAVLVVAAFVLFFVRQSNLTYVSDNNPAGVVQNFVLALHKGDYEKAYAYLADAENKPAFEDFRRPFAMKEVDISSTDVQISDTQLLGDTATVGITFSQFNGPFFERGYRNSERAELKLEQGQWKIRQMPYPYWYYDWYQTTPVK
ncbi:MAG: hypothetical protein LWX83_02460 [Anaerolineae bacterium]|nr:hypothetical protein [Anaerolineae bacterium]